MENAVDQNSLLDRLKPFDDVPVEVHAELDRRNMLVREIFAFKPGMLLVFPHPTGENVNLCVGGTHVGWGEILVVDGTIAIRIADLRDQPQRQIEE
jgi:flagellar motor switch/type III secretory pathway protein FliN